MIALSYSRISDYRQCPAKFKMKYLDKLPNFQLKDEDKSPALVRGGNIHKALDEYVKTKLRGEVPSFTMPEVIRTAPLIDKIMKNYNVNTEQQISIDSEFHRIDWYSKQTWFRSIFDLVGFGPDLLILDWKTGRFGDYEGSMECMGQLHLSSIIGLILYPEYDVCSCLYWFVDHSKSIQLKINRSDLGPMKEKLIEEHARINAEKDFDPKKNKYCYFCDSIRGQCQFATKN